MRGISRSLAVVLLWNANMILVQAQLFVIPDQPRLAGEKIVVKLKLKNQFREKVESARATAFLLDEHNKVVGHRTQWVIGGTKDLPFLAPDATATFNFVIPSGRTSDTNLHCQLTFNRVVLEGGKVVDPRQALQLAK